MDVNTNKLPYIPIIKWQQYERIALSKVNKDIKTAILPCFEIRLSDQHSKLLECYADTWNDHALVDYANPNGVLTTQRANELCELLALAKQNNYPITPALNPLDETLFQHQQLFDHLSVHPHTCIRLRVQNYSISETQIASCERFVKKLPNQASNLIIDLSRSPTDFSSINFKKLGAKVQELQSLGFPATHLISGAFPASLTSAKNSPVEFPRHDLLFWNQFVSQNPSIFIGYGDYGTLHPEWSEETLKSRSRAVAIRYTCDNHWFVIRGNNLKTEESIALSDLFLNAYGHKFKGEGYSWGDKIIADRANPDAKNKKGGHYHIAEAWNHHMTFVVKETQY